MLSLFSGASPNDCFYVLVHSPNYICNSVALTNYFSSFRTHADYLYCDRSSTHRTYRCTISALTPLTGVLFWGNTAPMKHLIIWHSILFNITNPRTALSWLSRPHERFVQRE